jgi:HEAT repeat protein
VLADGAVVWPTRLSIVRESPSRGDPARGEAALWLSRFARAALGGHPSSLATDDVDTEKDDVKLHAVFVLSQLPNGEGIPSLLDVARSKADLAVRQHALFWLGQSGDPRAVARFESLLRS